MIKPCLNSASSTHSVYLGPSLVNDKEVQNTTAESVYRIVTDHHGNAVTAPVWSWMNLLPSALSLSKGNTTCGAKLSGVNPIDPPKGNK